MSIKYIETLEDLNDFFENPSDDIKYIIFKSLNGISKEDIMNVVGSLSINAVLFKVEFLTNFNEDNNKVTPLDYSKINIIQSDGTVTDFNMNVLQLRFDLEEDFLEKINFIYSLNQLIAIKNNGFNIRCFFKSLFFSILCLMYYYFINIYKINLYILVILLFQIFLHYTNSIISCILYSVLLYYIQINIYFKMILLTLMMLQIINRQFSNQISQYLLKIIFLPINVAKYYNTNISTLDSENEYFLISLFLSSASASASALNSYFITAVLVFTVFCIFYNLLYDFHFTGNINVNKIQSNQEKYLAGLKKETYNGISGTIIEKKFAEQKDINLPYDIYRKIDGFLLPTFDKYKRDVKTTNRLKFLLKHHNTCNNSVNHWFSIYKSYDFLVSAMAPYYITFFIRALASIIDSKAILHAAVLI